MVGLFLSLYATRDLITPLGLDTPQHIWIVNLVGHEGLSALPGSAPPPNYTNADRPGYPMLANMVESILRMDTFHLTFILSAVMAATIALTAGAVALGAGEEPRWAFPVYALAVGASPFVARMGIGLTDNIVASTVLLAAATTALMAADGRPSIWATVFLLAAGVAIHWIFTLFFLGFLVVLAVVLLPETILARRRGDRLLSTPSVRLGMVLGGAAAAAGAVVLLTPAAPQTPQHLRLVAQVRKLKLVVPRFAFKVLGPVAAAGGVALAVTRSRPRLRLLVLALVWSGSVLAALFLMHLGRAVPVYRVLSFALGIPVLAAAALVGLIRLAAWKLRWVGGIIAGGVVLAALAGGAFLSHQVWFGGVPYMTPPERVKVLTAARYLQQLPTSRPVIVVVSPPPIIPFRRVRSVAPSDEISRIVVYPGYPDTLLQGRPTVDPFQRSLTRISRQFWPGIRPLLHRNPVIIVVAPYYHGWDGLLERHPGWVVGPGLAVARGPRPARSSLTVPAPQPPPFSWLVWRTVAMLLLLAAAGAGWAVSLMPAGFMVRAALSPAFGVAAFVLTGFVADRLGVRLAEGGGIAVAVVAAALGWAPFLVRRSRSRRATTAPA